MSTPTHESAGSLLSYTVGFVCSILLTVLAYLAVTKHVFPVTGIIAVIVTLAIAQLLVQLIFFLHVDRGSDARWNLIALSLAGFFIVILVTGSLWIMHNLDYNTQSGQDQTRAILQEEAIPR